MNIRKVLESGRVVRYHSTMIDKKQNNSEHSWEVGVILEHIYPESSKALLFYALTHDSGEVYTSDVAAPVKRDHPEIKKALDKMEIEYCGLVLKLRHPKFTKEELLAVKYADILSGIYFTTIRANAGDREAIPVRDKWLEYIGSLPYLNDKVVQTIEGLKS